MSMKKHKLFLFKEKMQMTIRRAQNNEIENLEIIKLKSDNA